MPGTWAIGGKGAGAGAMILPIEALLEVSGAACPGANADDGAAACSAPVEAPIGEPSRLSQAGPGAGGSTAGMLWLIVGPSALGEGAGAAPSARGIVPIEILSDRSGACAAGAGIGTACVLPEVAAGASPGAGAGASIGAASMLDIGAGALAGYPSPVAGAGAGMASRVVMRLVSSFAGTLSSLQRASCESRCG